MKYKIMGTNSDHDKCSICGKSELKKVVWLITVDVDGNDDSEAFPVGTTCASKLMTGNKKKSSCDMILRCAMVQDFLEKYIPIKGIEWAADRAYNKYGHGHEIREKGMFLIWKDTIGTCKIFNDKGFVKSFAAGEHAWTRACNYCRSKANKLI